MVSDPNTYPERASKNHRPRVHTWLGYLVVLLAFTGVHIRAQDVHLYQGDRRGRDVFLGGISPTNLTIGGKFEVEYAYEREGEESESQLAVDKLELRLRADLGEGIRLNTEVEWENGSEPETELDKVFLEVSRDDWLPFSLEAGRTDVLFGEYESHLIEDSLSQELGETKRICLQAIGEFEKAGDWEWSASWIAGRMDGGHQADTFALSLRHEPLEDLTWGISWMSDLGQSDELLELREEERSPAESKGDGAVQAANAFFVCEQDRWGCSLEGVVALSEFGPGILDEEQGRTPSTWSAEGWLVPLAGWELVGRIEGASDFPGAPAERYGVGLVHRLTKHLTVAADAHTGKLDSGESFDTVIVEAAIRF